jgi:hypothetical protein
MAGRPSGVRTLVRAIAKLTPAQLRHLLTKAKAPNSGTLERLERARDRHLAAARKLERRIAELSGGNGSAPSAPRGRKPGRRKGYKLSAATRGKMPEAAKRRYAGNGKTEAAPPAGKRTRKLFTAETRAKMAAAQQARWAKINGNPGLQQG